MQRYELGPRLGILPNLGQFLVQTLLVFFVGITVGLERNVVPLLARRNLPSPPPALSSPLW
jgi:hypothetical protein